MTRPEASSYSKTSTGKRELVKGELTTSKLILLGIIAMALSAFGPLSMFAPVPLGASFLLFGKKKTSYVAMGIIGFLASLATIFPSLSNNFLIIWIFCISLMYAFLISQIIVKGKEPMQGLYRAGGVVFSFALVLLAVFTLSLDVTLSEFVGLQTVKVSEFLKNSAEYKKIVEAGQADQLDYWVVALIKKPKEVATSIVHWSFAGLFISAFIGLWITLFMTLKNSGIWKHLYRYPYSTKELTSYKTPDYFVWPLIIGLALFVGSEHLFSGFDGLEVFGGNILICMAVFYFFQGFGIFIQLLDHLKFAGFFRTMIVICTVLMGWQIIVVAGVFDLWLNFRKFFEKKENEGDNL